MPLSRDQILARQDDLPTVDVPVPEWGDGQSVRVRGLKSGERMKWARTREQYVDGDDKVADPAALLIAMAAVDEAGTRLFQTQDVDALTELRGDVVGRISDKILELSGLTAAAADDAEGKSDATPSGDSSSDSAETSEQPPPSSDSDSPQQS